MASFLYEMERQGIIVAVFNIYDRIFAFMNTSTMIPRMAIYFKAFHFFSYACNWLNVDGSVG